MQDISFTFGIITNADNGVPPYFGQVVKSIRTLDIPEYEIVVVGHAKNLEAFFRNHDSLDRVNVIDFDESVKKAWITKKKNLITKSACYENIVYQHDYISYDLLWYDEWKKYGSNFKACMNVILDRSGERYRDWSVFPHTGLIDQLKKQVKFYGPEWLLPYNELSLSKLMYFSGAYWVAKKQVMLEFPLNEKLTWGYGEDVEWSVRFREKYDFSMNAHSVVRLMKDNERAFVPMSADSLERLKLAARKMGIG